MEYYMAIKRNELPVHAATWMNLKNIIQSKGSQTQKIPYCMILFIMKCPEKANLQKQKVD